MINKNKKIIFVLAISLITTFSVIYYINKPKMISETEKKRIVTEMLVRNNSQSIEELVNNINKYNKQTESSYGFTVSNSYSFETENDLSCKLIINHELGNEPYKILFYDKKGRVVGEYKNSTNIEDICNSQLI